MFLAIASCSLINQLLCHAAQHQSLTQKPTPHFAPLISFQDFPCLSWEHTQHKESLLLLSSSSSHLVFSSGYINYHSNHSEKGLQSNFQLLLCNQAFLNL